MSTPAREFVREVKTPIIDADYDSMRRRLIDESDTKRRIILNIVCDQCERQLPFSRCKVGDLGECVLEMVQARLIKRGD
jgi:hypothetical protein